MKTETGVEVKHKDISSYLRKNGYNNVLRRYTRITPHFKVVNEELAGYELNGVLQEDEGPRCYCLSAVCWRKPDFKLEKVLGRMIPVFS